MDYNKERMDRKKPKGITLDVIKAYDLIEHVAKNTTGEDKAKALLAMAVLCDLKNSIR